MATPSGNRSGRSTMNARRQRNGEHDADHPAECRNQRDVPVVELGPRAKHEHRGNGEDHAGRQALPRRGGGLNEVVLKDVRPTEQPEHRHRDDGGWDGGQHRQPGKQAQVGVGPGQHDGQHHPEHQHLDSSAPATWRPPGRMGGALRSSPPILRYRQGRLHDPYAPLFPTRCRVSASATAQCLLSRGRMRGRPINRTLRDWVFKELNGYDSDTDTIPEYRVLGASVQGNLAGPFNSGYKNIMLPAACLPEPLQKQATAATFDQPIASLEALQRFS